MTEIPDWIIANLSNYSKQQQAIALTWAYRNLPYDLLAEYYQWALWYRPAFSREIQDLVDKIGYRVEVEGMRITNGMGDYVDQSYGYMGGYSGGGGNLGQLPFGFAVPGVGVAPGIPAAPAPEPEPGIKPADIFGMINQGAATAGNMASAFSKINCAANPCTKGCPRFGTPQCGTAPAPSSSGLFSPGGQGDFFQDPEYFNMGRPSPGQDMYPQGGAYYGPGAMPGATRGYLPPGSPGVESVPVPTAPKPAPAPVAPAPAPAPAPPKKFELDLKTGLLIAAVGLAAYYVLVVTRK